MSSQPNIRGKVPAMNLYFNICRQTPIQPIIDLIRRYSREHNINFYDCLREFFKQGQAEVLTLREKASRIEGWVAEVSDHIEVMRANMPKPIAQPNRLTILAAALNATSKILKDRALAPPLFIQEQYREEAMVLIRQATEELRGKN